MASLGNEYRGLPMHEYRGSNIAILPLMSFDMVGVAAFYHSGRIFRRGALCSPSGECRNRSPGFPSEKISWRSSFSSSRFTATFAQRKKIDWAEWSWLPRGSKRWYAMSFVAFLLSMLSKASTAMLPALLLIVLAWRRKLSRRNFSRLAPFFIASILVNCRFNMVWLLVNCATARI